MSDNRYRARGPAARQVGPVDETRRKIVLATVALFDRLSYESVTIDAVARAAGVSKSTIYRHWPSRQRLVLDAFVHKTDSLTAVSDTGDAVDDLRTYVARLAYCLDFGGAGSTVVGLVAEAIRDDEFARLFDSTLIRGRRATFEAILRRGQQRGQIRPDADVDVAIDALYGAIHHRLLITRRPIDAAFVSALVDVTARGLAPGQPRHSSAKP